jgi:hypothetical protein
MAIWNFVPPKGGFFMPRHTMGSAHPKAAIAAICRKIRKT